MAVEKLQEDVIKSLLALAAGIDRVQTHPQDSTEAMRLVTQALSELNGLPNLFGREVSGPSKALAILTPLFGDPKSQSRELH